MFFQIDLEKNSSSLEGAVFSRPDVPGSVKTTYFTLYLSNLNPEGEVSNSKE